MIAASELVFDEPDIFSHVDFKGDISDDEKVESAPTSLKYFDSSFFPSSFWSEIFCSSFSTNFGYIIGFSIISET